MDQVGWWDEKHIPLVMGSILDYSYQFGRDENGLYDDPDVEIEVKKVSLINTVFLCNICNCHLPSFIVPKEFEIYARG
jgi:hypothetical protein